MDLEGTKARTRPQQTTSSPAECGTGSTVSTGDGTAATAEKRRQLAPATMTIFGAGGDLTKRLVVPALCHLVRAKELPDEFAIIGVDHNERTTEQWRRAMSDAADEQVCAWLIERMH